MASQWFIARDGVDVGTATSAQLQAMAQRGELLPTDHIWKEGMAEWRLARDFPRLFPAEEPATVISLPDEEDTADSAPFINFDMAPQSGLRKGDLPAATAIVSTAKKATASLKSAGSLVAKKAERTKIVTLTLPSAYAELGKAVYKDGSRRDEFTDLFQSAEDLLARRKQIHEAAKARPSGHGLAEKARKVAADATALARTKAIDLEAYQAFTRLGEAVYEQHGSDSGPAEVVEPIAKAVARRDQLDREIREITPVASSVAKNTSGTTGWLKVGGVAFLCFVVIGACVGREDNSSGEGNRGRRRTAAKSRNNVDNEIDPEFLVGCPRRASDEFKRGWATGINEVKLCRGAYGSLSLPSNRVRAFEQRMKIQRSLDNCRHIDSDYHRGISGAYDYGLRHILD